MPDVKPGESQKDYVSRCIPFILKEGSAKDQAQAAAMCYGLYKEHHEKEHKHLSLKSNFARTLILSRDAKIALCPHCNSDNLRRETRNGEGPKDRCMTCGYSFPHKPGTITKAQRAESMPDDPMEMEEA